MKKFLLIIAVIAVLSGCGNESDTLTCTTDNTVGTLTSRSTYVIDYTGDKIDMVTITYDYSDGNIDGVGTGTDGTTEDDDTNTENDGIVDGVIGEALDDVVDGVTGTILDIAGIRDMHNNRYGAYGNVEGFTSSVDREDNTNYTVTYTYDLSKLSDSDLSTFGIDRDFNTQKTTYTDRGLTCK